MRREGKYNCSDLPKRSPQMKGSASYQTLAPYRANAGNMINIISFIDATQFPLIAAEIHLSL
jgi:hypothetical protein